MKKPWFSQLGLVVTGTVTTVAILLMINLVTAAPTQNPPLGNPGLPSGQPPAGTAPGPQGPMGPPGAAGFRNLNCTIEARTMGGASSMVVPCPNGYTMVGGGFNLLQTPQWDEEYSRPQTTGSGNGWECGRSFGQAGDTTSTCYAVCCKGIL